MLADFFLASVIYMYVNIAIFVPVLPVIIFLDLAYKDDVFILYPT